MKKIGKLLGCLLPAIAGFACQLVVSVVVTVIYTIIVTVQASMLGITEETELVRYTEERMLDGDFLLIVTAIATFYTLVIGFFWYRAKRPKTDFSLKQVMSGRLFASMLLLGIALQILISMCLNVIFPFLPQQMTNEYAELMEALVGGNVWLSLLVTVVLAPLAEELLFRGVTLKKAQEIMPFMAANILQALLFGIYHGNLVQGVYAFVLGILLGFTAEYFHSIWASVLLHTFVNGSAELISLLPEAVSNTVWGLALLSALGVVLLFMAARLYPKARKELPVLPEACPPPEEKFSENSFDE